MPNRIFVGGISANTTEGELLQLFSSYGTVKAAKIIQDRAGVSKGYGFITFESEDDARRPLSQAENIVLKERKLNIAPAIKKQVHLNIFLYLIISIGFFLSSLSVEHSMHLVHQRWQLVIHNSSFQLVLLCHIFKAVLHIIRNQHQQHQVIQVPNSQSINV